MVANELKGSRKNYGVEIVQDFRSAFSFTMACEEGSLIEKRMPLLEKRILSALDELAYQTIWQKPSSKLIHISRLKAKWRY
tara:strand:+ start:1178 stop:1420 length:243 start_codon:yes stop_codon:yes gene_type:complete